MASYLYRTATTTYPCYLPVLREFSRSWPYKTCRCKYRKQFRVYGFEFPVLKFLAAEVFESTYISKMQG